MTKLRTKFSDCQALYAEDYDINQEIVKDMLEMMDVIVDIAEDGEQAVDYYQNNDYDIVFLDMQMPKKDGYQVAKEIRQSSNKQPIIVAITANALMGDREKCLEAGMDSYLCKPVETLQLEQLMRELLPEKIRRDSP